MAIRLAELAKLVDGELIGNGNLVVQGAGTLYDTGPGEITLVDTHSKAEKLAASQASAAIIPESFPAASLTMPAIRVSDVHRAFTQIVMHFLPPRVLRSGGVSPLAVVSPTATLGLNVEIYPSATIEEDVQIGNDVRIHSGVRILPGCRIADGVTIFPNAVLYENTQVGPRTIIHAGAVIGCYGFGYRFSEGQHVPTAQLGHVEIGADVEVGANTTIDRGTYGRTTIGDGTKIDNQVMIAHNCRIGRHNMICSQVGVAGSTSTGEYVVMAGQVGVRDHVQIGDRATVGAKAGVSHDIPPGACVLGTPATDEREQKLRYAAFARLPEMRKQLKQLQQMVDSLLADQSPEKNSGASSGKNAA
jgi:UDP-3-O-[3-hydroxymyristoyl] glucosamine N-acyltransferase